MHYFSLFGTDGKAEVVACMRELVNTASDPAFRAQSSANRKSLMMSVMTFVFA